MTTDNGTDFRVRTAGIQRILGFAQLELASVPEKLSVTNFCFCDDGLASGDRKNARICGVAVSSQTPKKKKCERSEQILEREQANSHVIFRVIVLLSLFCQLRCLSSATCSFAQMQPI